METIRYFFDRGTGTRFLAEEESERRRKRGKEEGERRRKEKEESEDLRVVPKVIGFGMSCGGNIDTNVWNR